MNGRLNKSLLFRENWHMPDSVFERVSDPCMTAIRTIFFNGAPVFQDGAKFGMQACCGEVFIMRCYS